MHRTELLRKSVVAGDWQDVLRQWDAYAGEIRNEIEKRTCTQARMKEAAEFLAWARRVVRCARAQAQKQLDTIHVAHQYAADPAQPPSSLRRRF